MGTSVNYHRVITAFAEKQLRNFGGEDLTREDAAVLLERWSGRDILIGDEVAEVIRRFPAAEPPAVPGLDFLPETQADADVLVAETVAVLNEPKPRHRSLSEKIADANAEAAKFNAEFPPGTKVEYWSGARQGAGKIGHTYGEAFASNSGQAVVFLDNASSYHALSHVKPLVEVVPQPNAEAVDRG